ncbi:MAG: phosphotransferase [Candidatus Nanopelagicales bacterium]
MDRGHRGRRRGLEERGRLVDDLAEGAARAVPTRPGRRPREPVPQLRRTARHRRARPDPRVARGCRGPGARAGRRARGARVASPPLWLHGDPHPLNLVADDDGLAGLLDFGDLTGGDPASDPRGRVVLLRCRGPGEVRRTHRRLGPA